MEATKLYITNDARVLVAVELTDANGNRKVLYNKPTKDNQFIKMVECGVISNCELKKGELSFTNNPIKVFYKPMAEELRKGLMNNNGFIIVRDYEYNNFRLAIYEVGFVYNISFCWVSVVDFNLQCNGVWVAFRKPDMLNRLKVLATHPNFTYYAGVHKLILKTIVASGKITEEDVTEKIVDYHNKIWKNNFKTKKKR